MPYRRSTHLDLGGNRERVKFLAFVSLVNKVLQAAANHSHSGESRTGPVSVYIVPRLPLRRGGQ